MPATVAAALLMLILLPPFHAGAQSNGWEEAFIRANQAYRSGNFQEAVDGYDDLIRSGRESGHLYYNLGNAYFRLNRIGPAILYYEKARRTIPRDADLNFNLRLARDQTLDAIPESQGFVQTAFFWLDNLSLNELFWGFALLNLLFWSILFIRLFLRAEWTYYVTLILLIFWLIGGLSFGVKWHWSAGDDRAVILVKEVNILAGPDVKDTVLFKLHEGAIVHRERMEEDWCLIRLPDGKRGWITAEALELI